MSTKYVPVLGETPYKPEDVDYDSSRLDVLNNHFLRMIEKKEIFCANYCLSRHGKVFARGAIGPKSFDGEGLLQPTTTNWIASITKTFTGVAVMKLVEDGLLRLDVHVGDILEQFNTPPFDGISILHLLTHTSGLQPDPNCFPNKYFASQWEFIGDEGKKNGENADWIAAGLRAGMKHEPGKEWMYCSFGFVVLGAVIEKITGMKAEDYIMNNIVRPLGMNMTAFQPTKEMAEDSFSGDEKAKQDHIDIINGTYINEDAGTIWSHVPGTGGGLVSNPDDLVKFGNMLLNHGTLDGTRIIGRKALEKMTTHQLFGVPDHCWLAQEPDRKYGVAFDMREGAAYTYSKGTFMHEGAGASTLEIDPVEGLVAAWFVPFVDNQWFAHGLYNATNIMWSGLK